MPGWGRMKSNEQETKKVPAPRLRFKQFEGMGEWEEKKLGEVLTVSNGRDYKHLKSGNIPVYGTGGYMLSVDDYLHEGESVTIGRKGTIDKPDLLYGKFWAVDTLFYTHSYRNTTAKFIFYTFQQINWRDYNSASGVPSLTKSTIDDIERAFPPLPEQTHIAACLSSLDAVIDAHTDKLDALRQHKRALMQQLFPQEGEKVPRLRFPEFEGSGEWEEKKLGEITMMSSGGTPNSAVNEYYGGDIPWVSISDMTKSGKYLNKTERKLTLLGLKNSSAKVFPEETILFAMYASIGKCNISALPVSTSQAILGIIPEKGISVEYLYYFLAVNEGKYADMGQTGTQKNLNAGMVKALPIPLPPLPQEQTRIAVALSSLDDLITAQADKVAGLREFKRGLMQGLFPSTTNHEAAE